MMPDSLQALADRVSALERQNRRQRWALLVIPLVALLGGAAVADVADWKGKSVTAERVTIVDAGGKPRVLLSGDKDGAIVLLDGTGAERITLSAVAPDGSPRLLVAGKNPRLGVGDEKGNVLFSVGKSEQNGLPYVELLDGKGKLLAGWGGNHPKP